MECAMEQHVQERHAPKSRLKVLIPVDESEHSEKAFDWYCERIHSPGDEVIIAHCVELPPVPMERQFPYCYDYLEEWKREADRICWKGEELLRVFKFKLESFKIANRESGTKPVVLIEPEDKSPARAICDLAKNEGINMIVIGARGMGKVRRTILGSVSDYVVHHAHVPVVVVPSDHHHKH